MINEEIAEVFEKMARVLAFKGEDRFRILAYERAARSLRDSEEDLTSIAQAGKLEDIPGIGHDLSEMIEGYIKTALRSVVTVSTVLPPGGRRETVQTVRISALHKSPL